MKLNIKPKEHIFGREKTATNMCLPVRGLQDSHKLI